MERVIALLTEKNDYLEKFYAINEHELINFSAGDFENVEIFYQTRDKVLDLIRCIDQLLEDENTRMFMNDTDANRSQVTRLFAEKDRLANAILAQDVEILSHIDREKTKIIKELRGTQQARRAVGAYASLERAKAMED
jgi:hypothetical protein